MADTYNNLYLDARRLLRQAGIEAAPLEARELLTHAAGKRREELIRDFSLYAPDPVAQRYRELIQRRLAGEPVAYLLGEWDFYGLNLEVCRDVLIPRPDTESLVERGILAVRQVEGRPARVLDLCTGSGCVGLAIADNCPGARVVLADWSEKALRVCRSNIRQCLMEDWVSTAWLDALQPPPTALGRFDVIVSNPPYIPTGDIDALSPSVREFEPRMALDGGEDGLDFYRAISTLWRETLEPEGKLIFEFGWDQAPDVQYIMAQAGYVDLKVFQDDAGNWRVVEGRVPAPPEEPEEPEHQEHEEHEEDNASWETEQGLA